MLHAADQHIGLEGSAGRISIIVARSLAGCWSRSKRGNTASTTRYLLSSAKTFTVAEVLNMVPAE